MGLKESSSQKVYLSFFGGKVVRRVKEDFPGAVSRTTKLGSVVWEKPYGSIEGILTDINIKEHDDYGKQFELTLADGEDTYMLTFPYSSSHSKGFLMSVENCDLKLPIEFCPYMFHEDGKDKHVLSLKQRGNKIARKYTKETPNGLPQMEQVKFKGKLQWDDTEQMAFLQAMLDEKIIPCLPKAGEAALLGDELGSGSSPASSGAPVKTESKAKTAIEKARDKEHEKVDPKKTADIDALFDTPAGGSSLPF
jgi:hypothetical protein